MYEVEHSPGGVTGRLPQSPLPSVELDSLRTQREVLASTDVRQWPSPWRYQRHCYCGSVSSKDRSLSAGSSA